MQQLKTSLIGRVLVALAFFAMVASASIMPILNAPATAYAGEVVECGGGGDGDGDGEFEGPWDCVACGGCLLAAGVLIGSGWGAIVAFIIAGGDILAVGCAIECGLCAEYIFEHCDEGGAN